MPVSLQRWLIPPAFDDEVRAGRARLLNVITLTVLIIAVTVPGLAFLFLDVQFPSSLVIGRFIPMIIAIVVARILLFRRRVELSSTLLVVFTWLVLAANMATTAGLLAPSFFGFFLVILLAGFLIGARAALITAGVSLLFGILMLSAHQAFPEIFAPPTIAAHWATGTVGFLVLGAFLYLVVEDYRRALDRIRASNAALQHALSELEERVASRTRDLSIAAEISQAISQTRDLDRLLAEGVELIWQGFNLYHVQIYLMDNVERNLIIRAGSGQAGHHLVAQRHTLPLTSVTINAVAAHQKRPVLVADVQENSLYRPNPLLPDTRAELAMPLISEQKVLGVLNVQSDQPQGLTTADVPAFETLAGQLAIAIENARLFRELAQSQATLEQQTQQMVQAGWQEFMDGVTHPEAIGLTYAGGHFQENRAEEITFTLAAGATHAHMEPIAIAGLPIGGIQAELDPERSISRDEEALIAAVARQVAQQVENLRLIGLAESYQRTAEAAVRRLTREVWAEQLATQEPAYQFDGQQVQDWETENNESPAGFVVPLSVRGEPVGEVAVGNIFPDSPAANMAITISERLSAHIENLRLAQQREAALRQTELRREELAAINRVARAVSRQLELNQLLETIHESISQLIEVETFIVFTYDAGAQKMHYPFVFDRGLRHEVAAQDPEPNSLSFQVIQSGKPLMNLYSPQEVAALQAESQHSRVTVGSNQVPASAIFVPLTIGAQTIGAMSVQSTNENAYTEQDITLLTGLANHVAVALDNAQLFNAAQHRADRERLVNEISQKILATNTVEAALQTTVDELSRAFRAQHIQIELRKPVSGELQVETRPENRQHPATDGAVRR